MAMAGGVRVRLSLRANCACAAIGPPSMLLIGMRARRPANARDFANACGLSQGIRPSEDDYALWNDQKLARAPSPNKKNLRICA